MNRLKEISAAGLAICFIILLAVVALSVPLWLGFAGTVQASAHSGKAGWRDGQTAPAPTPMPAVNAGVKWRAAGNSLSLKGGTAAAVANSPGVAVSAAAPPAGLSLSAVSGQPNQLQLNYAQGLATIQRYQFQLERRDLSARTETWTVVATKAASSPPATFDNVARGYHYRARGRSCPAAAASSACGEWSGYTNIVELSNPTIALSGLTGSYISGDSDAFTVTLSDLTLNQPYAVTLAASAGSVGSDYLCNSFPTRTLASGRTGSFEFTLHACQISDKTATAQSGTITARLWKGTASGDPIDTATANVTVTKATGSLSPVPAAITVGHDQTLTVNTNVPDSAGVWITATLSGDSGQLTLPPTRGCYHAISSFTVVNGATLTLRGCKAGTATITLYRNNSVIQLASYTVTVTASNTRLSPEPVSFTAGHDQTFTLNTDIAADPGVWITATVDGDPGQITLPPTQGCYHPTAGLAAVDGDTITIRGCKAGTATIKVGRANSGVFLKSYTVTVVASDTKLSPEPASFIAGHDQTFTLNTDIADDPGVWFNATLSSDPGQLTLPPTRGCYHPTSGRAMVNGDTITIRGCRAGTATITLYRANSGVLLKSYTVTVVASNTSLSPEPTSFTAGHDQTFTLTTDIANDPGVWFNATLSSDPGQLTLPPTRGCYHPTSGRAMVNGDTITIRGCRAGTATITLYRANSGVLLKSYTVTVVASNTSLSPEPTTFTAGHDQTFTLTTDIPNNPGVYLTATLSSDPGQLTLPPTRGCYHPTSGRAIVNGDTITIRGCRAGTATITLYRANSGVLLKSYTVTVVASDTELSPNPATFTIGTNQTFTVTTDLPNTPGLWVGLNYSGDTGRLVMSNQSCAVNSGGTAAVNGNAITLKPCRAGTVTIKVGRANSGVSLVTYDVTINSS